MKRIPIDAVLSLLLLIAAIAFLPTWQVGCTHTDASGQTVSPTENALIVGNDAYTFAVNEIDAALRTGALQKQQVTPYLPYRDAARAALDAASQRLAAGDTSGARAAIDAANAALAKLQPLRQLATAKGK